MASESWSAFTLQATSNCAVEAATCLADEMSFSSLAWPCTEAFAASQRLLVAAATIRAWETVNSVTVFSQDFISSEKVLVFLKKRKGTHSGNKSLRPLSIIGCICRDRSNLKERTKQIRVGLQWIRKDNCFVSDLDKSMKKRNTCTCDCAQQKTGAENWTESCLSE